MLRTNSIVVHQHILPKDLHNTANSPLLRVEYCLGLLDLMQIPILIVGENSVGNKNYEHIAHISPPMVVMLHQFFEFQLSL